MTPLPIGIQDLADATVLSMTDDRTPRWPAMTVEERTIQYSPSFMLDGPLDPYLEAYAARSADGRADAPVLRTLRYGDRPANTVDLALPLEADTGTAPLHVYIHGGYWRQLSKKDSFFLAPACLHRGEALAAVDYTLAPEASLDEIVDECCSALRGLRAEAESGRLPIDPGRITVSGSSAGAHLTAMAACRLPADQRPASVVLVSGIFDLEPLIATYINEPLNLDVTAAHRNSPSRHDLDGFPPTVVAWGDNETDEFKRQSRMFVDRIQAAGGRATEVEVPGRNHFDVVFDIVPDLTDRLPDQQPDSPPR